MFTEDQHGNVWSRSYELPMNKFKSGNDYEIQVQARNSLGWGSLARSYAILKVPSEPTKAGKPSLIINVCSWHKSYSSYLHQRFWFYLLCKTNLFLASWFANCTTPLVFVSNKEAKIYSNSFQDHRAQLHHCYFPQNQCYNFVPHLCCMRSVGYYSVLLLELGYCLFIYLMKYTRSIQLKDSFWWPEKFLSVHFILKEFKQNFMALFESY